MNEEDLIKKFPKIKDAFFGQYYAIILTREKLFSVEVDKIIEIFDFMLTIGYTYVGEIGIDCNKILFKTVGDTK